MGGATGFGTGAGGEIVQPQLSMVDTNTLPGASTVVVSLPNAQNGGVATLPGLGGEIITSAKGPLTIATLAGSGLLTVDTLKGPLAIATLPGTGLLTVDTLKGPLAIATLPGVSTEVVQPQLSAFASTTLPGSSVLSALALKAGVLVTMPGLGGMIAHSQVSMVANATFPGSSTLFALSPAGSTAWSGTVVASGLGALLAIPQGSAFAAFSAAGSSTLSATLQPLGNHFSATVVCVGFGTLSIDTGTAAVAASNTLSLVPNPNYDFVSFDDVMYDSTATLYLQIPQGVQGIPTLFFQTPHNGYVTIDPKLLTVGQKDILTPKGMFKSGTYLGYQVVSSNFLTPGKWLAFWAPYNTGAPFYVSK
jgi:hypothetical protein